MGSIFSKPKAPPQVAMPAVKEPEVIVEEPVEDTEEKKKMALSARAKLFETEGGILGQDVGSVNNNRGNLLGN